MKFLTTVIFFVCTALQAFAQNNEAVQPAIPEGILQSIAGADVALGGDGFLLKQKSTGAPMELVCTRCQGVGVAYDREQWWVLPVGVTGTEAKANRGFWILPVDALSKEHAWHLVIEDGEVSAKRTDAGIALEVRAKAATLTRAAARPRSDVLGHRFGLELDGGAELEQALAAFYWGTILPSVVEKTMAAKFPYHDGYVLSTLNVTSYAGSYPAVDHEFQIKGRVALGSEADLDVVRRMIELQFKLMNDDPEGLHRMPTSVQPDGRREYHVRRNSEDDKQNAAMFPLTGDIEVIEEAWRFFEARKDAAWLRANIANLEHAAEWVEASTDPYGRVWGDVYYEDQVIKDGRETQVQAFAAKAFELLAEMEDRLDRHERAVKLRAEAKKMAAVLVEATPRGYWDAQNGRFVDWVDRDGKVHDHVHLVANELPVVFGYATAEQARLVRKLVDENEREFERFPSFVAAKVEDYDKSEIGSGGPYDLCAAGRYWYWDAEYRVAQKQNGMLLEQLKRVAAEAAKNGYFMDERYEMDHVYYVDGKDSHGAQKYYEYPNVFAAVLIEKLLGLRVPADADVAVSPRLRGYGSVEFDNAAYALRYEYSKDGFVLKNLADRPRKYKVDLSELGDGSAKYKRAGDEAKPAGGHAMVTVPAHGEARWVVK